MKEYYDSEFCPFMEFRSPIIRRNALATIKGNSMYPRINGTVFFSKVPKGTQVIVKVNGLPMFRPGTPGRAQIGPHGFHIHAGSSCENPDGHWNPDNQPHGNHAGDFPVLFSNNGYAQISFFTDRFSPKDIVGKTVIIHSGPDDYKTQPSGGSGEIIACGVIKAVG